jgi:ribosomal protein L37AE/L43A
MSDKKEYQRKSRARNRKHVLVSSKLNGKKIVYHGLNKRPYPYHCELCNKPMLRRLGYHHWNDKRPQVGMWLCQRCYGLAEAIDSFDSQTFPLMVNRYLNLKKILSQFSVSKTASHLLNIEQTIRPL